MYKGRINYDREACLRLALVQEKCFGRTRKIVRLVLGLIPVLIGVIVGFDRLWGLFLGILGLMIYLSTSGMYERDAMRAYNATPDRYRRMNFVFGEKQFTVKYGNVTNMVSYSELYALVEDGTYFYLFINPQQAHMLSLADKDKAAVAAFKACLCKQAGKDWRYVIPREPMYNVLRKRLRDSILFRSDKT